ncbi:MAG: class I SAM-dependent rRNA methyltransferase [Prevotellaceae bacterium]|jgi:23S rRNA (cytosine1962-C5)-methyltransferase|nr:class I SAM-dependent rRNA methyltransferase [Prevotellaceae bacterium]
MKLYLKKGREDSIKRYHPWIFSGAIKYIDAANTEEGGVVEIYSSHGEFLGRGHYQTGSISVRILTFEDENIDGQFFKNRISEAYSLRKKIGLINNPNITAYRLVHGEGDRLSGLVIDVYGDTAVFQAHSVGMWKSKEIITEALTSVCKDIKHVYSKSLNALQQPELCADDCWLSEKREMPITVNEHGNLFEINPEEGQKTGFYIDQRENRLLVQKYSRNASVLNLFSYTGAFSVYAIRGGAVKTVSVDSSQKAIDMANKNVELNFGNSVNHLGKTEDIFTFLRESDEKFDLIILDPPAFAKHHSALKNALNSYKRLNVRAMEKLNSGGILFTFSCSQAVSEIQFLQTVFSAAAITGRKASILHCLNQPEDHPVNIYHPEGKYLKGLALYLL